MLQEFSKKLSSAVTDFWAMVGELEIKDSETSVLHAIYDEIDRHTRNSSGVRNPDFRLERNFINYIDGSITVIYRGCACKISADGKKASGEIMYIDVTYSANSTWELLKKLTKHIDEHYETIRLSIQ